MSKALKELKKHLKSGQVYRRSDLLAFSNSVDRHLQQLVNDKVLQKLEQGVYYYPKKSTFGELPPEESKLVEAFLKSDDFLIVSLNSYNSLKLGTTQLYNQKLVYNRKRDGYHTLNGRTYYFLKNRQYPSKVSEEFLLVDLLNNFDLLAENKDSLKENVAKKALTKNSNKLMRAVRAYGKVKTQKFFTALLENREFTHAR